MPNNYAWDFFFFQLIFLAKLNVIIYDFKLFLLFLFESAEKKCSITMHGMFPFSQLDAFDKNYCDYSRL